MVDRARLAGRAESSDTNTATAGRAGGGPADRIVFLGHATVLIELDGVRLLTDPLLRDHVAHLRRQVPPPDPATYADIDAVLISHLHHDHLDLASLRLLGLEIPLIVPAGAGELLRRDGFNDVTELRVDETTRVGALVVTAVEARHDGRRRPGPRGQRAETLGYLVNGRRRVYFAGDTELFEGMSSVASPHDPAETPRPSSANDIKGAASSPDVALLPVAGWGPTLGAGHMDPLDAARAARLIGPRIAIPMHWGTLLPVGLAGRHAARLGDPPRIFAEHLASLAPGVEVRTLQPGQETTL
jgi:L-ascorbate metabolism protein UlaG (beta-lactamase superfamily)